MWKRDEPAKPGANAPGTQPQAVTTPPAEGLEVAAGALSCSMLAAT